MLKETPPRQGFFERERYDAVRARLLPDLRVATNVATTVGGLATPALTALAEQFDRVDAFGRKLGRIIPFVFPHYTDGPRNPKTGQRRYVRGDQAEGLPQGVGAGRTKAGISGNLRHDFRWTAVRNIVNDRTPEKVAMMITGTRPAACSTGIISSRQRI